MKKLKKVLFIFTTFFFIGCSEQHTKFKKMKDDVNIKVPPPSKEEVVNSNSDNIETRQFKIITNIFKQNKIKQKKIDILWVVDNSRSMEEEQNGLANNFNIFIRDFITRNIDFQMGITTTDPRKDHNGNSIGDFSLLNSSAAKNDENSFIEYFMEKIIVGTKGSIMEQGLRTMKKFIERNETNWMRKDAYLIVIILSDEKDKSPESVDDYINYLYSLKENSRLVNINSIVNLKKGKDYGERYIKASNYTNGVVADITSRFSDILNSMGTTIAKLAGSFPLSNVPYDQEIEVFVNDSLIETGWEYISSNNTIIFSSDSTPLENSKIEIKYKTKL